MWKVGLDAWKACEEERRKEAKKRMEGQPSSQTSSPELSDKDFELLKTKLDIGLFLLKGLSKAIHDGVNGITPEGMTTAEAAELNWHLKNSSLLISTPCVLRSYPTPARYCLPDKTKRFPVELQAKAPPEEAAPAADPNYEPPVADPYPDAAKAVPEVVARVPDPECELPLDQDSSSGKPLAYIDPAPPDPPPPPPT